LYDFAHSYASLHPTAILAKGKIQVRYCAWLMPALKHHNLLPNFQTAEEHIYRWNVMPSDFPFASRTWQHFLKHHMNDRFPFAPFAHTTFVICGANLEDAEENLGKVFAEAEKHGWKVTVDEPSLCCSNVESFHLDTL